MLVFKGKSGTLAVEGYRFASADPKAETFAPSFELELPPKVDLRPLMTPVEDQGPLQSCTANAIAGAYEYLLKKHTQRLTDVSRLFIYYNARWRNNEQNEDSGSVIQYGMESLRSFGACVEKTWPYKPAAVLERPRDESYAEAARFRTLGAQKVNVDLDMWRQCLAEGYPIVFGCALFNSFDDCNKNQGVVPMPNPDDVARGEHGRHAMLCVGYSDIDQVFIVRNSWGEDWGVGGYCYMPYNYLMSEKLNGGDCWIMRGEDHVPRPQQTWVSDNRPLLRGFDSGRINAYAATAYDYITLWFFGGEEDLEYSESVSDEYWEFYESVETESYVEDEEDYVAFSEEDEESEEETDEESEEDESEDDEDSDDDADESDDDEDEADEDDDEDSDDDSEDDDEDERDEDESSDDSSSDDGDDDE